MRILQRRANRQQLVVGMTAVSMGNAVLQIGCADPAQLAAVAGKVGLSGRAVVIASDEPTARLLADHAARAGVLVEACPSDPEHLAVEDGAFDLVIVDECAGAAGRLEPRARSALLNEVSRALRPGGRIFVLGFSSAHRMANLATWLTGHSSRTRSLTSEDSVTELEGAGFQAVRLLAERDGLFFLEGFKPRQSLKHDGPRTR